MEDFRKWPVYRLGRQLVVVAEEVAARLPGKRVYAADQLRRASFSVPLNIGEGAEDESPGDKARFYRIALRSAAECRAIAEVLSDLDPSLDVSRLHRLLDQLLPQLRALHRSAAARIPRRNRGSAVRTPRFARNPPPARPAPA